MSGRGQFSLATVAGLLLAGIVHLGAILAIPWLSERDAFSRLRGTMNAEKSEIIARPGDAATWVPSLDPAVAMGACAYNLDEGPVRISAKSEALFQSLSFHSRGGGLFFAVTDRAAVRGALELVVMTRRQLDDALSREDEDEPSRDVRIVAPRSEGFVIVRVLAAYPSMREEAEALAKAVTCTIEAQSAASEFLSLTSEDGDAALGFQAYLVFGD